MTSVAEMNTNQELSHDAGDAVHYIKRSVRNNYFWFIFVNGQQIAKSRIQCGGDVTVAHLDEALNAVAPLSQWS